MSKRIERIRESQFTFERANLWTAFWTCPFFFVRKNLYTNIKHYAPKMCGKILDFGCGAKPYRGLFVNCTDYVGVDIEESGHSHISEQIDCYYDGKKLPFEDNYFDNIFSSEVFEHISNLDQILDELYRVLKVDGLLLVTVPFVWNEHEIPYDFNRFTQFGIEKCLKKHGFTIVESRKSTNYLEVVYQMKAEYYRYQFRNMSPRIRHIVQRTIISFQTLKGIIMSRILPVNWSLFADNIVMCKKPAR